MQPILNGFYFNLQVIGGGRTAYTVFTKKT